MKEIWGIIPSGLTLIHPHSKNLVEIFRNDIIGMVALMNL